MGRLASLTHPGSMAALRVAALNRRLPDLGARIPRPRLGPACAALLATTVLLMLARVTPLPGSLPLIGSGVLGVPIPVIGRVGFYIIALVLLFVSYVYALYCVRSSSAPRLGRSVVVFTAVLTVPAIVNPDLFSNDVYSYIFYGRMYLVHGLNPYVVLPGDAPRDPYISWVDWRNLLSPYGPIWTSWSVLLDKVVPGGLGVHVFAYKLTGGLMHVANTALVGAVVRKLSPRNAALGMAAYGWNPLPLTEFAGNAHNDSLMLLWVLGALVAYYYRRPVVGAALLGLAIATKFTAMLFVPFYLVALLRGQGSLGQRLRRITVVCGLIVAVWVVSWAPYMGDGGWRRMYALPPQSAWYLNSLPAVLYSALRGIIVSLWRLAPVHAGDIADGLVRALSTGLILVVALQLGRRLRDRTDLVDMWFWLLFAYLFFVGPYFWPWYATSLVMLAAISRQRYVLLVTTMLSLNAMVVYSCSNCRTYFRGVSDSAMTGLVIFVLPLLTLGAVMLLDSAERAAVAERMPELG
jgi:alpha-1,6-mannosyltransferase